MANPLDLALAKALSESHVVRGAQVEWIASGGWVITLMIGTEERELRAKRGQVRVFSTLDAAARVLVRDLGITRFTVKCALASLAQTNER